MKPMMAVGWRRWIQLRGRTVWCRISRWFVARPSQQHLRPCAKARAIWTRCCSPPDSVLPVPVAKARTGPHFRQGLLSHGIILMAPPAQGRQSHGVRPSSNGIGARDAVSGVGVWFDQRQACSDIALAHLCQRCAVQFDRRATVLESGEAYAAAWIYPSVRPDQPTAFRRVARDRDTSLTMRGWRYRQPVREHDRIMATSFCQSGSAQTQARRPKRVNGRQWQHPWPVRSPGENHHRKTRNTAPASADGRDKGSRGGCPTTCAWRGESPARQADRPGPPIPSPPVTSAAVPISRQLHAAHRECPKDAALSPGPKVKASNARGVPQAGDQADHRGRQRAEHIGPTHARTCFPRPEHDCAGLFRIRGFGIIQRVRREHLAASKPASTIHPAPAVPTPPPLPCASTADKGKGHKAPR